MLQKIWHIRPWKLFEFKWPIMGSSFREDFLLEDLLLLLVGTTIADFPFFLVYQPRENVFGFFSTWVTFSINFSMFCANISYFTSLHMPLSSILPSTLRMFPWMELTFSSPTMKRSLGFLCLGLGYILVIIKVSEEKVHRTML